MEEAAFGVSTAVVQFNTTDSRLEFAVTPLKPYSCYSYTIMAATAAGTGAQTSKHFFCTAQYSMSVHLGSDPPCIYMCVQVLFTSLLSPNAASSAPESLQVADTGPHSTLLHWGSPSHPNGVIVSYHIRYQCGPPEEVMSYETNTSSSNTSFLLTGLTPNTLYTVSAAAINGAGFGLFSEEQAFTTSVPSEIVMWLHFF